MPHTRAYLGTLQDKIRANTATEQTLQLNTTHAADVETSRHKTLAENFSAHTLHKKQTHYLSMQCLKCTDTCKSELQK